MGWIEFYYLDMAGLILLLSDVKHVTKPFLLLLTIYLIFLSVTAHSKFYPAIKQLLSTNEKYTLIVFYFLLYLVNQKYTGKAIHLLLSSFVGSIYFLPIV